MWYSFVSEWGTWLSQPFSTLFYSFGKEIPLIGALLLGMVGAFAPCQLSANVAALTLFGHDRLNPVKRRDPLIPFILGKVTVYSALGAVVSLFGEHLSSQAIPVFQWSRKMLAPLFILIGLFMFGWIRLPFLRTDGLSGRLESYSKRFSGGTRAFLLGFAFSLGFCPTMFWLFFGLTLPLMLSSAIGPLLPAVFALGTAIPLIVILLFLSLTGERKRVLKSSRKWGGVTQKAAGGILILLGISDFIAFW